MREAQPPRSHSSAVCMKLKVVLPAQWAGPRGQREWRITLGKTWAPAGQSDFSPDLGCYLGGVTDFTDPYLPSRPFPALRELAVFTSGCPLFEGRAGP